MKIFEVNYTYEMWDAENKNRVLTFFNATFCHETESINSEQIMKEIRVKLSKMQPRDSFQAHDLVGLEIRLGRATRGASCEIEYGEDSEDSAWWQLRACSSNKFKVDFWHTIQIKKRDIQNVKGFKTICFLNSPLAKDFEKQTFSQEEVEKCKDTWVEFIDEIKIIDNPKKKVKKQKNKDEFFDEIKF